MRNSKFILLLYSVISLFTACTGRELKIQEIHIPVPGSLKQQQKTRAQFISIAWSDLTGKSIDAQLRDNFQASYESFGDEKLIESWIVRNMMQRPEVKIPVSDSMMKDTGFFIRQSFQKFLDREPTALEMWQFEKLIREDSAAVFNPRILWLALMTSDEYRKF